MTSSSWEGDVAREPTPAGEQPVVGGPAASTMGPPVAAGRGPGDRGLIHSRPVGFGTVGIWGVLFGAWAGIVAFVGPLWGYRANGSGAWHWSLAHALLYLAPGAAAVLTGLWVLGMWPRARAGYGRAGAMTAGLILVACGAWLVLGPSIWPIFYTGSTVFGHATSPLTAFINRLGYNLGPGLVLATLGGMAFGIARREKVMETTTVPAADQTPMAA